jgi:hypothetical protein
MRTIEITAYKFDELSDNAKEKARKWWRDGGLDYEWWQFIYEDAEAIGLKITSFNLDRNRHATGGFLLSPNEVAQNILNNHGESCETYKTAKEFMDVWQPIFNEYMDEYSEHYESFEYECVLQDLESEFEDELLECYSIMLQDEYEYLLSDESIDENIRINNYEFDENGKLI